MPSNGYDPRAELLEVLLSKVKEDPYPSVTMLDTIEELLTPEELPGYTALLVQRIAADRFPSIPMIDRLKALAIG